MNNEIAKNDLIYLGVIILIAFGVLVALKTFESSWTGVITNVLRSI